MNNQPTTSPDFADFEKKLKTLYQLQDILPKLIEDDAIPEQKMDDYYVKLQIRLNTQGGQEKEPIEVADLFKEVKDQKATTRVLITAGAGMGKTTLMHHIAYEWSKDKIFNEQFDYIFKVKLKSLTATSLQGVLRMTEDDELLSTLICQAIDDEYGLLEQRQVTPISKITKQAFLSTFPQLPKEKVLLLLDGYDEIAHLAYQDPLIKSVMKKIFQHPNIVLTSRPNAMPSTLKSRFSREIEGTGLDHQGTREYIKKYFDHQPLENREALYHKLLGLCENSPMLREALTIPINTVMVCWIAVDTEVMDRLGADFSLGLLYQEVVLRLGKRYVHKTTGQAFQDISTNQILNGHEIQVLADSAYEHFRDNQVVMDGRRIHTLALEQQIQLKEVYQYGLLRTEHVREKQGLASDNLLHHDYVFVHLSFQEWLTAYLFKQRLLDGKPLNLAGQGASMHVAAFIARHRNEPRYRMTLKFLSSLLTHEEGEWAEQAIRKFWTAIVANIDGVIELGTDHRIALYMDMLGQAKKGEQWDSRIPHLKELVGFVDEVVCQDLFTWVDRIQSSGYLSERMKDQLLAQLQQAKNTVLMKNSDETSKLTSHKQLKQVLWIVRKLVFLLSDRSAVLLDAMDVLLSEKQEIGWQLQSAAMQVTEEMIKKSDGVLLIEKRDILSAIIKKVGKLAHQKDLEKSIEKFFSSLAKLDLHLVKIVAGSLIPLLDYHNYIWSETIHQEAVIKALGPLSAQADAELKKTLMEALIRLLSYCRDKEVFQAVIKALKALAAQADAEIQKTVVEALIPLLKDSKDNNVCQAVIKALGPLSAQADAEIQKTVVEALILLLKDSKDNNVRQAAVDALGPLSAQADAALKKTMMEALIPQLKYSEWRWHVFNAAVDVLKALAAQADAALKKTMMEDLLPLLKDSDKAIRQAAVNVLGVLSAQGDTELKKTIMKAFILLLKDNCRYSNNVHGNVGSALGVLAAQTDAEFKKTMIEDLIPLLKDGDKDIRQAAVDALKALSAQADAELKKIMMEALIPLLKDSEQHVFKAAVDVLEALAAQADAEIQKTMMEALIPLLKDSEWQIRGAAVDVLKALAAQADSALKKIMMEALILLLDHEKNPDDVRQAAVKVLRVLSAQVDTELKKTIMKAFILLLKSNEQDAIICCDISEALKLLVMQVDTEFKEMVVKTLTPLLNEKDRYIRAPVVNIFEPLLAQADGEFKKMMMGALIPLLKGTWQASRASIDNAWKSLSEQADAELKKTMIEALFPLLKDSDKDVRQGAIWALKPLSAEANAKIKKTIMEALLLLLEDSDYWTRYSAINALEVLSVQENEELERMVVALLPLLKDSDKTVRRRVIWYLESLSAQADTELRKTMAEALLPLLKKYSDEDTRAAAVKALGPLSAQMDTEFKKTLMEALLPFLNDSEYSVRRNTANILGPLSTQADTAFKKTMMEALIPLLKDSGDVRAAAVSALGLLSTQADAELKKTVMEILLPLLKDSDCEIREAAVKALGLLSTQTDTAFKKTIIEALLPCLRSKKSKDDSKVYDAAVNIWESLSAQADAELKKTMMEALILLLKDCWLSTCQCAVKPWELLFAQADAEFKKTMMEALLPLLKNNEDDVRQAAVDALGALSAQADAELNKTMMEALLPLLKNNKNDVRQAAVDALGALSAQADAGLKKMIMEALIPYLGRYIPENTLKTIFNHQPISMLVRLREGEGTKRKKIDDLLVKVLTNKLSEPDLQAISFILPILAVIGHSVDEQEADKKALIDAAKNALYGLIPEQKTDDVDRGPDLGVLVNAIQHNGFDTILQVSSESKPFLQRIYQILPQDGHLIPQEAEFIEQCIQHEFPTLFDREGGIAIEGNRYQLDESSLIYLDRLIACFKPGEETALSQAYKILHAQLGFVRPAVDMDVHSLVDSMSLDREHWQLSLMALSDHFQQAPKRVFLLLERRNAFGDYLAYQIGIDNQKIQVDPWMTHPASIDLQLRQRLFGEMTYDQTKPRYYAKSGALDLDQGRQWIAKQGQSVSGEAYAVCRELAGEILSLEPTWSSYAESARVLKRVDLGLDPYDADRRGSIDMDATGLDRDSAQLGMDAQELQAWQCQLDAMSETLLAVVEDKRQSIAYQESLSSMDTYGRAFYEALQLQLNAIYMACSVIHTEMIYNEKTGKADQPGCWLELAASHVPVLGIGVSMIATTLGQVNDQQQTIAITRYMDCAADAHEMAAFTEGLAYRLALQARDLHLPEQRAGSKTSYVTEKTPSNIVDVARMALDKIRDKIRSHSVDPTQQERVGRAVAYTKRFLGMSSAPGEAGEGEAQATRIARFITESIWNGELSDESEKTELLVSALTQGLFIEQVQLQQELIGWDEPRLRESPTHPSGSKSIAERFQQQLEQIREICLAIHLKNKDRWPENNLHHFIQAYLLDLPEKEAIGPTTRSYLETLAGGLLEVAPQRQSEAIQKYVAQALTGNRLDQLSLRLAQKIEEKKNSASPVIDGDVTYLGRPMKVDEAIRKVMGSVVRSILKGGLDKTKNFEEKISLIIQYAEQVFPSHPITTARRVTLAKLEAETETQERAEPALTEPPQTTDQAKPSRSCIIACVTVQYDNSQLNWIASPMVGNLLLDAYELGGEVLHNRLLETLYVPTQAVTALDEIHQLGTQGMLLKQWGELQDQMRHGDRIPSTHMALSIVKERQTQPAAPAVSKPSGLKFYDFSWAYKKIYYAKDLQQFSSILQQYQIDQPLEVLKDPVAFKQSVLFRLHPDKGGDAEAFVFAKHLQEKISTHQGIREDIKTALDQSLHGLQSILYKTNLGLKLADTGVDVVRWIDRPTLSHTQQVVWDSTQVYGMLKGGHLAFWAAGASAAYQCYQGEISQAVQHMATTVAYMALPVLATYSGVPYLGVGMSMGFSAYAASHFAWNAYSLYQEQTHENYPIESAVAYRDLFKMIADSPLAPIYDFASIVKSYDLQIEVLRKQENQKDAVFYQDERADETGYYPSQFNHLTDTPWDL